MKFSSFALLSLFAATSASAQTAPRDTAEKKVAPVTYQIRNPRVTLKVDDQKPIDNANVQYGAQFSGAVSVEAEAGQAHMTNIRQLTFGGENTAPSFSPDGSRIVFEARSFNGVTCKQIFSISAHGTDPRRISTGNGEAQSATFSPKGERILFTSTHAMINGACPPPTDLSLRNPIAVNPLHDIYVADTSGKLLSAVTADGKAFDGLPSISPDNKKIVFSSTRQGDVDLYILDLAKNEIKQLTSNEGFEGFARFSPDGSKIVFSGSRKMGSDVGIYRRDLLLGNVDLSAAELYVMDADGSNVRQLTANGALNINASFTPNGEAILFSSNMHDSTRADMAIYGVNLVGGDPIQFVNTTASDDYPMFSPDGKKIVYVSTRGAKNEGEKNIFIADWKN